jgi:hypothetical protein
MNKIFESAWVKAGFIDNTLADKSGVEAIVTVLHGEIQSLRTQLAEAYRDADEVLRPELQRVRTQLAESQAQVAMLRNDLICGITILTGLNIVWADKFSPEMVRDINEHTGSTLSTLAATAEQSTKCCEHGFISMDASFIYESEVGAHPIVTVRFALEDWESRDAFVKHFRCTL